MISPPIKDGLIDIFLPTFLSHSLYTNLWQVLTKLRALFTTGCKWVKWLWMYI